MRLQDMKLIMDSLPSGSRKEELKKVIERHDFQLKVLNGKQIELEAVETIEEKFGDNIFEIVSEIVSKYFNNQDYSKNGSNDFELFESLCILAKAIQD